MKLLPTPADLVYLDDQALQALALHAPDPGCRISRQAFGIACALEIECRRRIRTRESHPELPVSTAKPWWKRWTPARSTVGLSS